MRQADRKMEDTRKRCKYPKVFPHSSFFITITLILKTTKYDDGGRIKFGPDRKLRKNHFIFKQVLSVSLITCEKLTVSFVS